MAASASPGEGVCLRADRQSAVSGKTAEPSASGQLTCSIDVLGKFQFFSLRLIELTRAGSDQGRLGFFANRTPCVEPLVEGLVLGINQPRPSMWKLPALNVSSGTVLFLLLSSP